MPTRQLGYDKESIDFYEIGEKWETSQEGLGIRVQAGWKLSGDNK